MEEKQKKMTKEINLKGKKGITLIALVITVIVLLILAGVTIATLTGDNGLLTKAGEAKNASEIAEEKDIISISAIQAQSENKYGNLEESKFSEALNTNSKAGNKASIIAEDIGSFTVKFESNRYYEVDKNGNIGYVENVTGEKTLTVQCVNSKNEVLGEYEYLVLTDKYSKLPPAVDKYESSEEKIEGEMTENKTIQVLYYLICNDDTTLVFTGLDGSGNITTNENEIASYMVGDGSNTKGNGLKETARNVKISVKIPEQYKGKNVTKLATWSFLQAGNIIKIDLSDNLEIIGNGSIDGIGGIEYISLGRNLKKIESYGIFSLPNLKKITFNSNSFIFEVIAFAYCPNWTKIEINNDNSNYKVVNNVIYSMEGETLILVPKGDIDNLKIVEGTSTIAKYSFAYTKIKELDIPNSVVNIDSEAFNGSSLESITIGENVKNIGKGNTAFWNSTNLKQVTINSKDVAKNISNQRAEGAIIYYAETIYIKSDITEIGSYITDNYNIVESDKEGYIKYVKN